jgi:hypothetical protein
MWPRAKKWLVVADWTLWELAIREGRGRGVYKGTFPSSSGSLARRASSRVSTFGLAGGLLVVAEAEPPHGLTTRILHPERFGVLDDGPWRREAAGRHHPSRAK